jgi:hypothetical protein
VEYANLNRQACIVIAEAALDGPNWMVVHQQQYSL